MPTNYFKVEQFVLKKKAGNLKIIKKKRELKN